MNVRRTEDHHHTAEQVAEYVAQAQSICDEAPLLEDERLALLPVIVTLLASKQVFYEQMQHAPLDLSRLNVGH